LCAEAYDKLLALVLRQPKKAAILRPMHFSRHIAQSHSTFSLLAALLLRVAR